MTLTKELYEKDYDLWLKKAIAAIKNQDYHNLDWDNLLVEVAEVGKSQQRALKSYTKRLIEHILKIKYWELERNRNLQHWQIEVETFREEIQEILQDSPSLKKYLSQNYANWFIKSRDKMQKRFYITEKEIIPLERILEEDYYEI